jgi:proline iminopeptidase
MRIEIEPGVRLFVDIDGFGLVPDGPRMREKPALILLHGGPGYDHATFKPFFSRFSDLAQVLCYDHRGHGRSDRRPGREWTLDTFADDVVRLCDALGIVKPIVLGQSFGGFVAQRYLARHPEHPSRVILSSTSHHWGLDRKLDAMEKRGGAQARAVCERFWTNPSDATYDEYNRVCKPLYNTTRQSGDGSARTVMNEEILYAFVSGEKREMNLRPGLSAVQCPVLVMAGEDDPVTPIEDAREIAEALPGQWMQFESFPNAGHGVWRDDPEAAFAVLRRFLSR